MTRQVTEDQLTGLTKRFGPDGIHLKIAELWAQHNPMIKDWVWREATKEAQMIVGVRAFEPKPSKVDIGEGVKPQTSRVRNATFNQTALSLACEISKDAFDLVRNENALIMNEEKAHLSGINTEIARLFFYGNEASDPREFDGMTQFYNKKGLNNNDYIIDAGGTGNQLRSIWLIGHGEEGTFMHYPVGSKAGIKRSVRGIETAENSPVQGSSTNDGLREVYRSFLGWKGGVAIKDPRKNVRIANIDPVAIKTATEKLPVLIQRACNRLYSRDGIRPALYGPREILEILDEQNVAAVSNSSLKWEEIYGKGIFSRTCQGIPIEYCTALDNDELQVT